ncbi:MAG: YggT family protein [Coriobacteriia bacterium]|nr:YggT family protein [Coriobacteriia bacterium]
MSFLVVNALRGALNFYAILIFVYVLLSLFPLSGTLAEIYYTLGTVTEPYLSIFRRFIPPIGRMDISPVVGYFVIQAIIQMLGRI